MLLQRAAIEPRLEQMRREEEGIDTVGAGSKKVLASTGASSGAVATRAPPRPAAAATGASQGGSASAMNRLQSLARRGTDGSESVAMSSGAAGARGNGMLSRAQIAQGAKTQRMFERFASVGAGCYFLYILAFPLRLIVAPYFFHYLTGVLEVFGIGNSGEAPSLTY
jgi:hypothetical protein